MKMFWSLSSPKFLYNAIKYTENKIIISSIEGEKFYRLEILNNGDKVEDRDAPFIFEKGFTGEISYNKNQPGWGFTFAKNMRMT
jgi:signal transduction histidine kinase